MNENNAAELLGHDAYNRGVEIRECPFNQASVLRHYWCKGWLVERAHKLTEVEEGVHEAIENNHTKRII